MIGKDWGGEPKPRIGPLGVGPARRRSSVRKKVEEFGPVMYVDILGPMIGIKNERCYVLTVQDRRSKYAVATFIPNQEPARVVKTLVVVWILTFGLLGLI